MADIGSYILAGSQGLASGIDKLGTQFRDAQEREQAQQLLTKLGLFNQAQNPIPNAQPAVPNTLASLSQPSPQPIAQQNPGNATTAQLPPISPANRPVAQGFANEMGQKWAQQSPPAPQRQAMSYSGNGVDASGRAISGIESGGRYDALGPLTKGDRAYGKYQVMGANIPAWTQAYVGRAMTPQEFVASPEAQEAVFRGEFGRLSQKYGPEGAARAWFAGEGGMNDRNRRDVLGTSVADYSSKFVAGGGAEQGQANPLANVTPMGGSPTPQQPQTLAQLSAPPQQSMDMGTLAALMTNKYTAPIGAQIIAKQLGRDPVQMQMQLIELQKAQMGLQNFPTQQQMLNEQLRGLQLGNQKTAAEISGEGKRPITVKEGETLLDPVTKQPIYSAAQKPGEFDKSLDKKSADMFGTLLEQRTQAESDIADVRRLQAILPNAPTGLQARAARAANAIGVRTEAGAMAQEFDAIISRLVPAQRPAGSGTMSDRDVDLFKSSLPSLTGTPDGNSRIMATMQGIAEYKKAQSDIAEAVASKRISKDQGLSMLKALPNPLEWVRQTAPQANKNQTAVPKLRAQDKAAFDALPSGTRFIDPNGVERIKP